MQYVVVNIHRDNEATVDGPFDTFMEAHRCREASVLQSSNAKTPWITYVLPLRDTKRGCSATICSPIIT